MPASAEPAILSVVAEAVDGQTVQRHCQNVLTGELWVCSGQSNMEWPVGLANDAENEKAAANYPEIRLLAVPKRTSEEPESELARAEWRVCSPETICQPSTPDYLFGFSAVAYFFGRELYRRLKVPIGLINASVGGTCAEAWISRDGLQAEESLRGIWENYAELRPLLADQLREWEQAVRTTESRTEDTVNKGYPLGYAGPTEPAGTEWRVMELPANWRHQGLDFNGIVWFRRTVDIPAAWAHKPLRLSLGAIDKSDTTYFNGVKVGSLTMQERPDAWSVPRVYTVPAEQVRPGPTVIAVRVHNNQQDAGLMGPAPLMTLSCPEVPAAPPIPLTGTWRYLVEENYGIVTFPPRPLGDGNCNTPTMLFNGMIAPLTSFAIRGVIWYQGEGNADRAGQYRTLFPALIRDWRKRWATQPLPFHFVQLANFITMNERPEDSQWAQLREAQTETLALPDTGMAVAIDIGNPGDIHPRNKQDVGLRLACSVLHKVYQQADVVSGGPLFRSVQREDDKLRVGFDHLGGGLICRGETLQGFTLAGADGIFAPAVARIEGETVVVSSPAVPEPRSIRYAWADNPTCNLYNAAGLPASPFRAEVKDAATI